MPTARHLRGLERLNSDQTGEGEPKATSLSATQELKPPTVADVLEVFGHFQENLLEQIDRRDKSVLELIQKTVSEFLEQYTRVAKQQDDLSRDVKRIDGDLKELWKKYNSLSSDLQALKLQVARK